MLTIKGLNKTYSDGTQALNNINLTLPTGMVGLLGPNGAGKSTLLRTLACLQAPSSGSIHFAGCDILKNPTALRAQLGYLPQEFGVYPHMSCKALLMHLGVLKGATGEALKSQIDALLSLTNLTQHANKAVTAFSGGMRQRFGIAQALLGDPKFLIMDEPTSGLDPQERDKLHDVLVSISQNKLILLSSHIVEDIENLCPYVALIQAGQIKAQGGVKDLIAPLTGHIWLTKTPPNKSALLLNKHFRHGEAFYRVYASHKPSQDATALAPSLQDTYFYALASNKNNTLEEACHAE